MTSIVCSSSCIICGLINLQHNKLHQPVVNTQSTATHSTISANTLSTTYQCNNLPAQQLTTTQSTQPSTSSRTAYMDNAVSTVQCSTTLLTLTTTQNTEHTDINFTGDKISRQDRRLHLLQIGSRQAQSTSRGSVHLSHRS